MMDEIICGDALIELQKLPDESIDCCVTSPPYYGLRDYGVDGQIGLEESPEAYVSKLVEVFREVRRVLKKEGTLWLNLGDSYAGPCGNNRGGLHILSEKLDGCPRDPNAPSRIDYQCHAKPTAKSIGMKPKDLIGIPWMVAFALRADGWYLRSDIIWHKPNCMPESVTDRPTKAHEYIFLLSKSERYFYDNEAIKEPDKGIDHPRSVLHGQPSLEPSGGLASEHTGIRSHNGRNGLGRNKRSVWTVTTKPYSEAHFATFPEALIEPCIKAGCPEDGLVLDPFFGAGTTGLVARKLCRHYLGIELNAAYCDIARKRIAAVPAKLTDFF